jgi:hypothetical protein
MLSKDQKDGVIAMLRPILPPASLDRLTDIWRYEFGSPHRVGNELIRVVHMWPRVPLLFDVLQCAQRRLSPDKLRAYSARIDDIGRHLIHLTEIVPNAGLPVDRSPLTWMAVALKDFCLSFVGTCRCMLSGLKGTCTDGDERPAE